jgi:hypothetical protein
LGTWIRDTPPLALLADLPHTPALRELRGNPLAAAQMRASAQWARAHRWADQWASDPAAYTRALDRDFAAQHDVQAEAWTLNQAEAWAFETAAANITHATSFGQNEIWDLPGAQPIVGADLEAASTATLLAEGWLRDLERHILPAPPTAAAHAILIAGAIPLRMGRTGTARGYRKASRVPTRPYARSGEHGRRSPRPPSAAYKPTPSDGCTSEPAPTATKPAKHPGSRNGSPAA